MGVRDRHLLAAAALGAAVLVSPRAGAGEPYLGAQLGGPAFFELVFRPRIVGPVSLELGAMAVGQTLVNASAGLYVGASQSPTWAPYVAAGAGVAAACGTNSKVVHVCDTIVYGSGRLGVSSPLGEKSEQRLTVDAGAWYGRTFHDEGGASRRFLVPMAGIGYYW